MKIFNYPKKEKKLFGKELPERTRNVTKTLVKIGYDDERIMKLLEAMDIEAPSENFDKYLKYIKHDFTFNDCLYIGAGVAIGIGAAYAIYKIGFADGTSKALDSDMYKDLITDKVCDGKEQLINDILSDAVTKPGGCVVGVGKIGYLVTKFVTERPDGFDPTKPVIDMVTGVISEKA